MKIRNLVKRNLKGRLVDRVRIYARGGAGGQGSQRLGGIGGDGGSVKVVCTQGSALEDIARRESRRFIAESGGHSVRGMVWGEKGRNLIITVPPGTVVQDSRGIEFCDLDVVGANVELVHGGKGGSAATVNHQGQPGERGVFVLELKVIADVGMVGFPNAGKSTLLRALSNATPKVADYPFTTVRPHVGVMSCDSQPIKIADLPGLVEGAHVNVGMGHRFLRHVERTKVLLYVVDVGGFQLSTNRPHRTALQTVSLLARELECYQCGLSLRPSLLVVNKMDVEGAVPALKTLVQGLTNRENVSPDSSPLPLFSHILPTAALRGEGVEAVKAALRDTMAPEDATDSVSTHVWQHVPEI